MNHFGLGEFHSNLDFVVGQRDRNDMSDLDAGHLNWITGFQLVYVAKLRADAIATFDQIESADHFENDDRRDECEGEEESESGFERVFHGVVTSCLKSTVRKRFTTGSRLACTSGGVPAAMILPSEIKAIRS